MSAQGHRQLKVWQMGMDLAAQIQGLTLTFPREELYGLVSQMRRAAVSILSNIAEGYGRGGRDYARFVSMAYGSLLELETQIELARRFEYVDATTHAAVSKRCSEVGRMLNGLRSSLTASFCTLNPAP